MDDTMLFTKTKVMKLTSVKRHCGYMMLSMVYLCRTLELMQDDVKTFRIG